MSPFHGVPLLSISLGPTRTGIACLPHMNLFDLSGNYQYRLVLASEPSPCIFVPDEPDRFCI